MKDEIVKHNRKFVSTWERGANEFDSKLIIAIGETENGRYQTYSNDGIPLTTVIKILRHTALMLETLPVKPIHYE